MAGFVLCERVRDVLKIYAYFQGLHQAASGSFFFNRGLLSRFWRRNYLRGEHPLREENKKNEFGH